MDNPLVEAAEVADLIARGNRILILDATSDLSEVGAGLQRFLQGHIPGAIHVDLNTDLSAPHTLGQGRHPLPEREQFATWLAQMGADERTYIICYDHEDSAFACRAWWLTQWVGYPLSRVLNGGFTAWAKSGGEVCQGRGESKLEPVAKPDLKPLVKLVELPEILPQLRHSQTGQQQEFHLVDCRAEPRYRGESEPLDSIAGHIPGAVNLPYTRALQDGYFRPVAELTELWQKALPESWSAEPLTLYCGSGVSATVNVVAATVAGMATPALYAGSWSQYSAQVEPLDLPVATGPASLPAVRQGGEWLPLRPELRTEKAYGAPHHPGVIALNVNENPYPPSLKLRSDLVAAVDETLLNLNRYPSRDFKELRVGLCEYLSAATGVEVEPEQIWAGNGSNEVMMHLLGAFAGPGRAVLTFPPTYSMYVEYARNSHSDFLTVRRDDQFNIDFGAVQSKLRQSHPAVLLVAAPNNPTGTALGIGAVSKLCELAKGAGPEGADALVVVDEAYAEFCDEGYPSALTLLGDNNHLVVSRTLSKAFGAAGLRLGYLVGHPRIIEALKLVRLPYHLSAPTQALAVAALKHAGELRPQIAEIRQSRDDLAQWLQGQGWQVAESQANFIMFGTFENRHEIWQGLLQRGVLIREVGPPGWLRVSIGTPEENEAFKRALKEVTVK